MFERFTDKARRVLVVAQEESRTLHHSFIAPEHLLLGLIQGEGLAAEALNQLGVSLDEVRNRVAQAIPTTKTAGRGSKVPFSPQAKRALELSLREALGLGHKYIGTEHLILGLLRGDDHGSVTATVGVAADKIRTRVLEVIANGPTPPAPQSSAVVEALQRARQLAGSGPLTTGQLLLAVLADDNSQASRALVMLDVDAGSLKTAMDQIPLRTTSDAPPRPRSVEITLGSQTTTIDNPELAAVLSDLSAEQLASALRNLLDAGHQHGPPFSED